MGFMDKAKKLVDEAQKQFQGGQQEPSKGDAVRYDEQGRPIQEGPPAGDAPPPSAQPPEAPTEPAPEPSGEGGAEGNPDPFKPIQ